MTCRLRSRRACKRTSVLRGFLVTYNYKKFAVVGHSRGPSSFERAASRALDRSREPAMSQPTPYNRTTSFTNLQALNPTVQPPGTALDVEFNNVKATLDQVGPSQSRSSSRRETFRRVNGNDVEKREALKLRPGDRIIFGDSMWSRDLDHRWRKGTVLFVTTRGGIRVRTKSGEEWVPYHYVIARLAFTVRKLSRARAAIGHATPGADARARVRRLADCLAGRAAN